MGKFKLPHITKPEYRQNDCNITRLYEKNSTNCHYIFSTKIEEEVETTSVLSSMIKNSKFSSSISA